MTSGDGQCYQASDREHDTLVKIVLLVSPADLQDLVSVEVQPCSNTCLTKHTSVEAVTNLQQNNQPVYMQFLVTL